MALAGARLPGPGRRSNTKIRPRSRKETIVDNISLAELST